jgi:hypothetical protein
MQSFVDIGASVDFKVTERVEHNPRHLCRRGTIKIMQVSRPQAGKFPLYQGRIKCFVRYVGRAE